ncbi:MAG: type 1 glutamine amidotransferase [Kiloniellales bacterium]
MRFLVFQHIAIEHPGVLRDFMAADGVTWDTVELDEGETIPQLDGYDALIVMGGPMDVWQEAEYPWLVAEKAAIREAVSERKLPYLGLCLGHQLLGAALGGKVGPMARPEVGILEVELTDAGRRDPLFRGIAPLSKALQWHGAAVIEPPPGALVLAQSPLCPVQAMRVGEQAYGIQYHVELTADTVGEWGCVPAYEQSLEAVEGPGALAHLNAAAAVGMAEFNRDARQLYDNFMALLRGRRAAAQ